MITGTFRHGRGTVYDLKAEGKKPLTGVTGTHPFWSVDRQAWVPVKDPRVGERLQGLGGTPRVESLALRGQPEPVYNIEVEADHCYRAGGQGLLVHNASAPSKCSELNSCTTEQQDQFLRESMSAINAQRPYPAATVAVGLLSGDNGQTFKWASVLRASEEGSSIHKSIHR